MSSLKPEDCVPEWHDLEDMHKTILSEWYTFLVQRYNVVGKVRTSSSESSKFPFKLYLHFRHTLRFGETARSLFQDLAAANRNHVRDLRKAENADIPCITGARRYQSMTT